MGKEFKPILSTHTLAQKTSYRNKRQKAGKPKSMICFLGWFLYINVNIGKGVENGVQVFEIDWSPIAYPGRKQQWYKLMHFSVIIQMLHVPWKTLFFAWPMSNSLKMLFCLPLVWGLQITNVTPFDTKPWLPPFLLYSCAGGDPGNVDYEGKWKSLLVEPWVCFSSVSPFTAPNLLQNWTIQGVTGKIHCPLDVCSWKNHFSCFFLNSLDLPIPIWGRILLAQTQVWFLMPLRWSEFHLLRVKKKLWTVDWQ